MKDINEIMLNPVRMRIIQVLAANQNITTAKICEIINDVPRTTLYRHIKILLDNNILTVISEQKIRGSLERTLALNTTEITKHNTIENATQNAFSFLMNKYTLFQKYFDGDNPDPAKYTLFLYNTILMLTDTEFNQFLSELKDLFNKYRFEYSDGRKSRDIAIISAPEVK